MKQFKKYQHVERFGTAETSGIDIGACYVFPKLDGSNGQIWFDGKVKAGSRNRELTLENDNHGFYKWVLDQYNIALFFDRYPSVTLYGEWLVPHTLKTYQDSAWNKFYVFDVVGERYLKYEEYKYILEEFNIDYVPPICKIENPTYERLINQLEKNTFLIKDGEGSGEGIVIKNYDYVNKYGRLTWAKIVKNEFKEKFHKKDITELKEKKIVELDITEKYVTKSLVEKEYAKIDNETGWTSKQIPRLLNTVYYCLIKEESWNFIKDHKRPVIDFRRLYTFTIKRVKELKPELF